MKRGNIMHFFFAGWWWWGGSCPPSEPPHFCLYLQTSSLAPTPAFLTPSPSLLGIELLIAFFHVEVSHFLQLCQGSPELRRGWLLQGGVGVCGGGGRGRITNQEAVRRRAPSLPPTQRVRDRTSSFICRSQTASKGQRQHFVG